MVLQERIKPRSQVPNIASGHRPLSATAFDLPLISLYCGNNPTLVGPHVDGRVDGRYDQESSNRTQNSKSNLLVSVHSSLPVSDVLVPVLVLDDADDLRSDEVSRDIVPCWEDILVSGPICGCAPRPSAPSASRGQLRSWRSDLLRLRSRRSRSDSVRSSLSIL